MTLDRNSSISDRRRRLGAGLAFLITSFAILLLGRTAPQIVDISSDGARLLSLFTINQGKPIDLLLLASPEGRGFGYPASMPYPIQAASGSSETLCAATISTLVTFRSQNGSPWVDRVRWTATQAQPLGEGFTPQSTTQADNGLLIAGTLDNGTVATTRYSGGVLSPLRPIPIEGSNVDDAFADETLAGLLVGWTETDEGGPATLQWRVGDRSGSLLGVVRGSLSLVADGARRDLYYLANDTDAKGPRRLTLVDDSGTLDPAPAPRVILFPSELPRPIEDFAVIRSSAQSVMAVWRTGCQFGVLNETQPDAFSSIEDPAITAASLAVDVNRASAGMLWVMGAGLIAVIISWIRLRRRRRSRRRLLGLLDEEARVTRPALPADAQDASVPSRLISGAIDIVIVLILAAITYPLLLTGAQRTLVGALMRPLGPRIWTDPPPEMYSVMGSYTLLVVFFVVLYPSLTTYCFGKSVGTASQSSVVVNSEGSPPDLAACLARSVMMLVDFVLLVGWITMLCSSRNRRLGDFVADTSVVKPDSPRAP